MSENGSYTFDHEAIAMAFQDRTLPKALWTHEAHLTTAIWFIMKYEGFDALCRIKSGIISYNLSVGGENNGTNGYHETITVFWWRLLSLFVSEHKGLDYESMCAAFLKSAWNKREIIFDYYSKESVLSQKARAMFIHEDIQSVRPLNNTI